MRGDSRLRPTVCSSWDFNPRPSYEGRPGRRRRRSCPRISIHAPRMRGDFLSCLLCYWQSISIHAPRMRGDTPRHRSCKTPRNFNPRPSYEGRHRPPGCHRGGTDFNPRPSYEGRPRRVAVLPVRRISIHAPRMRGDDGGPDADTALNDFNPRPSYEGRPWSSPSTAPTSISIHAPRMRGDHSHGARPVSRAISIHAPRMRGDCRRATGWRRGSHFNPRPSYEGRPHDDAAPHESASISIHAPRMRGDPVAGWCRPPRRYFNPRPSYEGRPSTASGSNRQQAFQSTPLV